MSEQVVASFEHPWEARMAADHLRREGLPARVETRGPAEASPFAGPTPTFLVVPEEWVEDALGLLAPEPEPEPEPELEEGEEPQAPRRPLWVAVVALLVVAGLVTAAVPRVLWLPVLLVALIGLVLWHAVRPAPRSGADRRN
jgi:hypothetical protein